MNQTLVIAAVLMAAALTGIFSSAYATAGGEIVNKYRTRGSTTE